MAKILNIFYFISSIDFTNKLTYYYLVIKFTWKNNKIFYTILYCIILYNFIIFTIISMNYYLDPITKHYVDFDGKATRKEFWMFVLINFLVSIIVWVIWWIIHLWFLGAIYSLWVFLPSLAITVRRLHDIGKSWWWILISLIPFIWAIWLFILLVFPSKDISDNKKETNNVKEL